MKNLMTIMFVMLAIATTVITFIGCEGEKDEDKAPAAEEVKCDPVCTENQECKLVEEKAVCVENVIEEVKCDPACDNDKQECKLVENKPACVDKTPVVEEPECSEAKPCADDKVCKEGKCEAKPEEPEAKPVSCEPVCDENKECKCEADKCECIDKVPAEESKPEVSECGEGKPECAEGKECKEGKCEDKAPAVEEPKVCEPACGEGKVCDNGECKDKPTEEPVHEQK